MKGIKPLLALLLVPGLVWATACNSDKNKDEAAAASSSSTTAAQSSESAGALQSNSSLADAINTKMDEQKLDATLVLRDLKTGSDIVYNETRANERKAAASTFKIPNALIALDSKTVKDVDTIFYKYDGSKVFLESWAQDSNLRYAISVSQVPAFKQIAREVGQEKMQSYLDKFDYGNKTIGSQIDTFWLDNSLQISAKEQIAFLEKLYNKQLVEDEKIQQDVHDILYLEDYKGFKLYGKTGYATDNVEHKIAWIVGFIESPKQNYIFALNFDCDDFNELPRRLEIIKSAVDIIAANK